MLSLCQCQNVNHCKYLGLILDQTMKWEYHVNQICLTVSKYIGLFYRIRELLSAEYLNKLYKALILPRTSYCDVVCGNCNKKLQDRIEPLQNRAGRAILKVPVRTPSSLIRDKLGWNSLYHRRRNNLCLAVYKCLSGNVPESLHGIFTTLRNKHTLNTRGCTNGNISLIVKPRTEAGRRTFIFRGTQIWNALPANTKNHFQLAYQISKNGSNQFQFHSFRIKNVFYILFVVILLQLSQWILK